MELVSSKRNKGVRKMKLSNRKLVTVSFMLFSLFFGAGNLIFPPFLGQNAGAQTLPAVIGFCITAVVLPILGVIVIAKTDGLQKLASRVNEKFAIVFTVLIYLSIGPGLGIPRAASVPFEMAVSPYLPENFSIPVSMLIYSLIFFLIEIWLALNPNKLVSRIGNFLTPCLLILIVFLFGAFLFKGDVSVVEAQDVAYQNGAFLKGFCEGYQTMDTIAALNFGLVIATTLQTFGMKEKNTIVRYTSVAGIFAGIILAIVYGMLTYMGMASSGVYPIQENGAWTLRCIVYQLFGDVGAILLAAIFSLACLTTCVGLITSISQYFATLTNKFSYKQIALIIIAFSFVVCNQGLTTILSISVPILNAIYPVAIILILLGLADKYINNNPYIYPFTIFGTAVISVISAIEGLGISFGMLSTICHKLPFYSLGFGWVTVAIIMMLISYIVKSARN